jgi:hypothetical protein
MKMEAYPSTPQTPIFKGDHDLLVSDVIRTNETQVWFLSEHLVDTPLARAD